MTVRHAIRGLAPVAIVLCLVGITTAAGAQLAGAMGSLTGSYCKIGKNDRISVSTTLPLDRSEAFARQMTLRRLASLARSRDFPGFVVTKEQCGTLAINGAPRNRSCRIEATMTQTTAAAAGAAPWFGVDAVLRDTRADSAAYPVPSGLMNHGNKCVID